MNYKFFIASFLALNLFAFNSLNTHVNTKINLSTKNLSCKDLSSENNHPKTDIPTENLSENLLGTNIASNLVIYDLSASDNLAHVTKLHSMHKRIDLDPKNRVLLTHNLLSKLDGLAYGIGATQVKNMLELIALIRTLQIGVYHKENKTHEGLFVWKDQKVSIRDLSKIETDSALSNDDHKIIKKMLNKAREQFLLKTQKNSERTAPIKKLILRLITECCEKRGLGNSFLLTWGETSLEEEAANFHRGILSFTDLDRFLSHLTIFMKDLIYSCPKAFEQFNQLYGNRSLGYENMPG